MENEIKRKIHAAEISLQTPGLIETEKRKLENKKSHLELELISWGKRSYSHYIVEGKGLQINSQLNVLNKQIKEVKKPSKERYMNIEQLPGKVDTKTPAWVTA
jgi:hypothetical protein